jgi:hypothetical protein
MDNLVRLRDLEGQYDLRVLRNFETDLHETKTNFLKSEVLNTVRTFCMWNSLPTEANKAT